MLLFAGRVRCDVLALLGLADDFRLGHAEVATLADLLLDGLALAHPLVVDAEQLHLPLIGREKCRLRRVHTVDPVQTDHRLVGLL